MAADPASVAIGAAGRTAGKARRAAWGGLRDKLEWLFAVRRGKGERLAESFTTKHEAETELAQTEVELRQADVKLRLAEAELKQADAELRRAQAEKARQSARKETALAAGAAAKTLADIAKLRRSYPEMGPLLDEMERQIRSGKAPTSAPELPPADTH
jgi:hypothetical protein